MKIIEKERENNYDFMRIVCALAVIAIHVSSIYVNALNNDKYFSEGIYTNYSFATCIWNTIGRFAVPCFIMLSGAFILDKEDNKNFMKFYKKSFNKIGITIIFFTIVYFLFSFLKSLIKLYYNKRGILELLTPFKLLLKGEPFYHMWYVYMIIGIYIVSPVIIIIKEKIGEKSFKYLSIVYMFFSSISGWTSNYILHYSIGKVSDYLGYFMIGYVIRKNLKKNNFMGCFYIIVGVIIEFLSIYLKYIQLVIKKIPESDVLYNFNNPLCPIIVIASISIFIGFSKLKIKTNFYKLSDLSLYIYLIHPSICELIKVIILKRGYYWDNRVVIPCLIIIIFFISTIISVFYKKILQFSKSFFYKNVHISIQQPKNN